MVVNYLWLMLNMLRNILRNEILWLLLMLLLLLVGDTRVFTICITITGRR